MEATLLYLLQANVVLALFAAAYYGLLRRLTFFQLNRTYLLGALLFAAVYPALPVPALWPAGAALLPAARVLAGNAAPAVANASSAYTIDWQGVVFYLYAAGAVLLLLRLVGQLISLLLVWARSRPAVVLGQSVRVLAGASGPFSFGRTIYLSAAALADTASLAPALRHEQAHVRQLHTLDVLLTQVATALAWVNPAAWLLRRAVLDNLEYLADHAALQTGLDRRAYQYSLLRQQPGGVPAPALAFHFSFLTLKNRITMLNQPASTTRQLGRYLLAAPLVLALALGYSAAHAQVVATPAPAQKPLPANTIYYLDGKQVSEAEIQKLDQKGIDHLDVLKDAAQKKSLGHAAADGVVLITTKANANSPSVLAFNKRFPLTPATPAQNAAVAIITAQLTPGATAATSYVAQKYPGAKLESVSVVKGQADRYLTIFTENGKRMQLLFDGQGQPVPQ